VAEATEEGTGEVTGTPAWLELARCRQLGLRPEEFIPNEGASPSARALACCQRCPARVPCGEDRGDDVGLRGDGWRGGRNGERRALCEDCGREWIARGGAYKRCPACAEKRRKGAA
jgi:hypothetical protein